MASSTTSLQTPSPASRRPDNAPAPQRARKAAAARAPGAWAKASRRELAASTALLSLLGAALCATHVVRGGLYYDDWSVAALSRFAPGGLVHGLWLYYGQRPGQVVYYAALDRLFGVAAAPRIALAAAAAVLQASLFYALLRRLGARARDGLACAALALAFPFSDSVRLWGILSLASLAIAAWLLGVILALRALQGSGVRSLALHGASLALYAVGILSYEVFAVAECLAGLIYMRAVGFARARTRWAADVAVIASATLAPRLLLPIDIATPSRALAPAAMADHALHIARAGARLAGLALVPLGSVSPWAGALVIAAVLSGGGALALQAGRKPHRSGGAELRGWLAGACAGAGLAAAGWAVYVPAPEHYLPTAAGPVNRVNALAALGLTVLVYCTLALFVRLAGRVARASSPLPALGAPLLALAVGAGYVYRSASDARAWDRAAAEQRAVLADLHAALPRPPAGAVIYALNVPDTAGPGVPVLGTTLDLTSAARLSYASAGLRAVPLATAAELHCGARGPGAAGVQGAFGASYLLDVRTRRAVGLTSRAACAAAVWPGVNHARAAPAMAEARGAAS
jgi:hypothetical protein